MKEKLEQAEQRIRVLEKELAESVEYGKTKQRSAAKMLDLWQKSKKNLEEFQQMGSSEDGKKKDNTKELIKEIASLRKKEESMLIQMTLTQEQLAKAMAKIDEQDAELVSATENVREKTSQIERLTAIEGNQEANLKKLDNKLTDLTTANETLTKTESELRQQVSALSVKLLEKQSQLDQRPLSTQLTLTPKQVEQASTIAAIKNESFDKDGGGSLRQSTPDLTTLQADMAALKWKLTTKEKTVKNLLVKYQDELKKNKELKEVVSQSKNVAIVPELQARLAESEKRLNIAEKLVEQKNQLLEEITAKLEDQQKEKESKRRRNQASADAQIAPARWLKWRRDLPDFPPDIPAITDEDEDEDVAFTVTSAAWKEHYLRFQHALTLATESAGPQRRPESSFSASNSGSASDSEADSEAEHSSDSASDSDSDSQPGGLRAGSSSRSRDAILALVQAMVDWWQAAWKWYDNGELGLSRRLLRLQQIIAELPMDMENAAEASALQAEVHRLAQQVRVPANTNTHTHTNTNTHTNGSAHPHAHDSRMVSPTPAPVAMPPQNMLYMFNGQEYLPAIPVMYVNPPAEGGLQHRETSRAGTSTNLTPMTNHPKAMAKYRHGPLNQPPLVHPFLPATEQSHGWERSPPQLFHHHHHWRSGGDLRRDPSSPWDEKEKEREKEKEISPYRGRDMEHRTPPWKP
jgi:hypothetical protein